MREPNTELLAADYEKIDAIFDLTERVMLKLAARHEILGTSIERWRWDVPDITMSWKTTERYMKIGKNIRFLIKKVSREKYTFTVDVNAWCDDSYFAGVASRRLWNNATQEFAPRDDADDQERDAAISTMLSQYFEIVHSWTFDDLHRHHLFSAVRP